MAFKINRIAESHMCDDFLSDSSLDVAPIPRMTIQVASNTCHLCKLFLSIVDKYDGGRKLERIELTLNRGYPYDNFYVSGDKGGVIHRSPPFYIFTPSGTMQSTISVSLPVHANIAEFRF